jgi:hypothetical protein
MAEGGALRGDDVDRRGDDVNERDDVDHAVEAGRKTPAIAVDNPWGWGTC